MWVFGMVDTTHNPALGYMEAVPARDANTLLPIIQAHVAPGTIIHSDEWRAYSQVASLPSVASHGLLIILSPLLTLLPVTHPEYRVLLGAS